MRSSRITLYRSGSWREGAQPHRIWIDGGWVGLLSSDGSLSVEVQPGQHTVCARTMWFRCRKDTVIVSAGEHKWIQVTSAGSIRRGRRTGPMRSPLLVIE
jgi:hypothetical protein